MTAEELIAGLAARLGLPSLAAEEPGRWRIVFDGEIAVDFLKFGPAAVRLETALGPLPEDEYRAERLLRKVLERNLAALGVGVARNVLFLDPDDGILRLKRTENSAAADEESFAAAVEDFADAAEAWLELLASEAAPAAPGFALRM